MNVERVEQLIRELLVELGEDPNREGLARTPARVAKSWESPTRGYRKTPADVLNQAVFKASGRNMVIVRNIEIFSLCEHHLLPFFGRCQVGYIPQDKVVGVSKIARIAEVFARRLQIQERLTEEIAQAVMEATGAMGVGVVMEAKHLCMMMRGVEKQHSSMVTSAVLGSFRSDQKTREEFLSLIRGKLSLSGNLVLIGMPASGKSTIGILLAKVLGLDFVDTDVLLQKQQRRLLSEILADEGPAGFLKAEDEMLSRFQGAATVVATGGSAVYHEAGMRRLRRTGRVVWIDVPLAELRLRLGDMSARGVVLAPGQTLEQLYAERRPLYEKWADMRLEVVQERLETTVDRLAELIRSAPRLAMPAP